MGKVRLKITPSLASIVNTQATDWLILEEDIGETATIGDLLADLTSRYPDFGKVVFNPDIRTVSDQINIVLNDSLLPSSDMTEVKLNDGDNVILLPVYSGG